MGVRKMKKCKIYLGIGPLLLVLLLMFSLVSAQGTCQITGVSATENTESAFYAVDGNIITHWNYPGYDSVNLTIDYSCEKTASNYSLWCEANTSVFGDVWVYGNVYFYDENDNLVRTSSFTDCKDSIEVYTNLGSPVSAKRIIVEATGKDSWTHINEFGFGGLSFDYPVGAVEGIDGHGIVTGWAYDSGDPSAIIDVHFAIDEGEGCKYVALRRAMLGYPDEHRFRFEVPVKYKDGRTYTFCIYGLDPEGVYNTQLSGSPITFTASPMGSTIPHTPAWAKDMILYKFRVDYFTDGENHGFITANGNFTTAREKIPYLKDLGVTGILLFPLAEYPEYIYPDCPYGVSNPEELDSSFGTEQDFIDFVQEAHDNGMKVFVDIVTFGASDVLESHPEWSINIRNLVAVEAECNQPYQNYEICMTNLCGPDRMGCCNCISDRICDDGMECLIYFCSEEGRRETRCYGSYGPIYDRDNLELRDWWINDVALHWIETFDIDGFRCDLEPWMSGFDTWEEVIERALDNGKEIIIMSEVPTRHRYSGYHFSECDDFSVGNPRGRPDFMATNQSIPGEIKNVYNIVDEIKDPYHQEIYYSGGLSFFESTNPALQYYKAQGRIVYFGYANLLAPFVPYMTAGEEFNAIVHIDPNNNIATNLGWQILDWSDLEDPGRQAFLEKVKKLIKIRKRYYSIIAPFDRELYRTNIVKVSSSGTDLQAYALYGDISVTSKAAIVVVGKKDRISGSVTIDVPLNEMDMGGYAAYSVVDLMTDECEEVSGSGLNSYTIPVEQNDFKALKIEPGVCSICGNADINKDNVISMTEFISYISQWKSGSVTILELMIGIREWKNGC